MNAIVVSSGSGVLKYRAGTRIDAFDVVIRCNYGFPCNSLQFHDFGGSKTTHIALNGRFDGDPELRSLVQLAENYADVEGILAVNFDWTRNAYTNERLQELFPGKTCLATNPRNAKEAHLGTGFPRASCGLLAALHAVETFGEVWVYGFEPERGCRHFYDETRFELTCPGIGSRAATGDASCRSVENSPCRVADTCVNFFEIKRSVRPTADASYRSERTFPCRVADTGFTKNLRAKSQERSDCSSGFSNSCGSTHSPPVVPADRFRLRDPGGRDAYNHHRDGQRHHASRGFVECYGTFEQNPRTPRRLGGLRHIPHHDQRRVRFDQGHERQNHGGKATNMSFFVGTTNGEYELPLEENSPCRVEDTCVTPFEYNAGDSFEEYVPYRKIEMLETFYKITKKIFKIFDFFTNLTVFGVGNACN